MKIFDVRNYLYGKLSSKEAAAFAADCLEGLWDKPRKLYGWHAINAGYNEHLIHQKKTVHTEDTLISGIKLEMILIIVIYFANLMEKMMLR